MEKMWNLFVAIQHYKDKKNAEKYLELAREGANNVADEFIDEYEEELDQLEDMIDEL